jgi:serine/threonine protein kinase
MKNARTDRSAAPQEITRRCEQCGATTQAKDGICVSCFLREGLQADGEDSAEDFERRLTEDEIPDKPWRLGNYEVLCELGRGGMGVVLLARRADAEYEKRVAIKLIKRGMDSDAVLGRFRAERQILAGFDHPNIARLFDGGTTEDGLPYFVMEYVEGLPIDKYCHQHALSLSERLNLFREICAAVSYAHRHLVVHRDIKRTNILVTTEGVPKLLDFGIAKILQHADGAQPLATMTGLRLMTPEYASPEQVCGDPVTTATDVYSLGVVLYELLTGRLPYRLRGQGPRAVERAIIKEVPARPSTALAKGENWKFQIPNPKLLRGDLDNIVLMALRKEPGRRYQSAEQLSEDIGRHLEARPVLARNDTVGYRSAKFVRRNKPVIAVAALVFLSLVGGIIATTWQAQRAREQKITAERRFADVRQLAHSLLFDYHDAIKDLPGATRVRERLVKDALANLDRLSAEAHNDPLLQRELAAAYERLGDVRGQAYSASLGDRAGAVESYQKALKIREGLAASNSRDAQNRRDLASSYRRIGNQLLGTREAAEGVKHLRKALGLYLPLSTEQPTNSELRGAVADTYNDIGLALEDSGDASGALESQRQALSLREALVASDPQNPRHRRDLSLTDVNLGRAFCLTGDVNAALKSNHKGLVLRDKLAADDPTNTDYRRLLAISYQNDGDYKALLGDVGGALESFRKKLTIDEQSFAADPANAQARGDLGYSCLRMGELLAQSGDHSRAIQFYQRALTPYKDEMTADPQAILVPMRVSKIISHLGEELAKSGQRPAAEEQCRNAMALLSRAVDDPNNAVERSLRAQAFADLGDAYSALAASEPPHPDERQQYWREARGAYVRSLEIWQASLSRGTLTGEDATKPQAVAQRIAECDAALRAVSTRQ